MNIPNVFTKQIPFIIFLLLLGSILYQYLFKEDREQALATAGFISSPKIDDFYFLDFRLMSDKLRPKEKYRLAKIVDITGDIITLLYGDFYYTRQRTIKESIRYGHLRFKDYFQEKRYDFKLEQLKAMNDSGAIYMVKRPVFGELYDNGIKPYEYSSQSDLFIPGKRENTAGLAFLNEKNLETSEQSAFDYFSQSADYGYAQGQLNLAQMLLNGQYVKKDLVQSLYWFKQASLQSYKPAILKYEIVCKQVESCDIYNFFKELVDSGVNIKVRSIDVKLSANDNN